MSDSNLPSGRQPRMKHRANTDEMPTAQNLRSVRVPSVATKQTSGVQHADPLLRSVTACHPTGISL